MNILQEIFSEQFIYALGWTLIHSLWQGALIGLIIAILIIFMYKYTARLRYFIYSISLFLFAGIAVLTFISAFNSFEPENTKSAKTLPAGINIYTEMNEQDTGVNESSSSGSLYHLMERTVDYVKVNIPFFVAVWMLGMLMMFLRFLGGYALVRRYRCQLVKPVMGDWERKFRELAGQIGISKNVRLLESALVKVPMAIGYLKPVVLIPLGALNGIPARQMEAIFVHELAHIRRRDFLMNMIQSLLEVVFFYHPVVWWLSKNIRIERENICDDIAITLTGNTMEFAKALTKIQEINLGPHGLAAGLGGKNKNRLLNRIRRLTGKPRLQSGFTEGFIAAAILVISLISLTAAAMVTYPADKIVKPESGFTETSLEMPVAYFVSPDDARPDTVTKKEQKEKQQLAPQEIAERKVIIASDTTNLSAEEKEKIRAVKKKIEAEMMAVEAEIEAFRKEFEAADAYTKAIEHDWQQFEFQAKRTLPHIYLSLDSLLVNGDDSLLRYYRMPEKYIFLTDSIQKLYLNKASEHYADFDQVYSDLEKHHSDINRQIAELQKLQNMSKYQQFFDQENFYPIAPEYVPGPILIHHENDMFIPRTKRIITDELHEDGLIHRGREYIILIGKKQMLINGEKQSRSTYKKYRRLLDSIDEYPDTTEDKELKFFITI